MCVKKREVWRLCDRERKSEIVGNVCKTLVRAVLYLRKCHMP